MNKNSCDVYKEIRDKQTLLMVELKEDNIRLQKEKNELIRALEFSEPLLRELKDDEGGHLSMTIYLVRKALELKD